MAEPVVITRSVSIEPSVIEESFGRASGPGGHHVTKVASAVQIRFSLVHSPSIPEPMKRRVAALAGRRLTKDGVLVITADSHRDQPLNRAEALEKLVALLRQGAQVPKTRLATRPTLASKQRRLQGKSVRAGVKRLRSNPRPDE